MRGAVVLDVAQLEALLSRTFSIGLDAGRGREKVALARLRLSRALPGAAATQAMAAGALAIEQGVATEQIAAAGGLALHAAAFTGMPDPVLHLAARAMGVATGLAALEPDPRAPGTDVLLDAIQQAATRYKDGTITIGRSALRDAVFGTKDYQGITGTLSWRPASTRSITARVSGSRSAKYS